MAGSFVGRSSEELSADAAAAGLSFRILHTSMHNWLCQGREGGRVQSSLLGLRPGAGHQSVDVPEGFGAQPQRATEKEGAAPPARSVQTRWPHKQPQSYPHKIW